MPGPVLAALRASLDAQGQAVPSGAGPAGDRRRIRRPRSTASPDYEAALQARRAVIDAQREELLRWRDAGHLPDASLRILEGELDHEERTLPPHSDALKGTLPS